MRTIPVSNRIIFNLTLKTTMSKIHSGHIEVAVAKLIGYRTHCIVPNVSWGLGLRHECDMLILDQQDRFTEIEIKISRSDLKADFNKAHGHKSKLITRLVYAVPNYLLKDAIELVPKTCGIISVYENEYPKGFFTYEAEWVRTVKHKKQIEEIPKKTIRKFMELGCMRIWSLKERLFNKCS